MSTLNNVESVSNQQGSFKPSIPREGPITDKGHKPGVKVNEADQRPEYHMEAFPPGTAPASNSYTSNANEIGSQANNPNVLRSHGKESTYTSPADTLTGATSKDVHTGLGKPLQGQSGVELAHDGAHGRKEATLRPGGYREEAANAGARGNKADRAAEDMRPEGAETLDTEWKYEPRTQREKK
ncbi:uncharacterized protein N7477_002118 [Penicillium maclennaniae]|uniref:uncharacterized protein n=1 Tax=Penicillium maclennaniae TaxID=1343394 RepID=UPI002540A39C|nr:uncharacterized protein N7477_002118 [Penicillium maclennaniae]KAJ5676485.1 hypothetical protein N7477_002118 [Penicillium maclennaniae]